MAKSLENRKFMPKAKSREASFETSLASLEQIVHHLESGELPLEQALELFEEGVRLARRCQDQLSDVEQRVEVLLRERGEVRTAPLELPPDAASPGKSSTRTPDVAPELPEPDDGENLDESIPF